jgi:hypothetical protein
MATAHSLVACARYGIRQGLAWNDPPKDAYDIAKSESAPALGMDASEGGGLGLLRASPDADAKYNSGLHSEVVGPIINPTSSELGAREQIIDTPFMLILMPPNRQ